MRNRVVHILTFVCSMPLALPQGWCCLQAWTCANACGAPAAPGSSKSSCSCCCNGCALQTTDTWSPADRSPDPKKPVCRCPERDVALPPKPSIEKPDAELVVFVPLAETAILKTDVRSAFKRFDTPSPTPSIHVLICVWRC